MRLILLLGLLHLALKHVRNVELVGLLAPLFLASPFAAQWRSGAAEQAATGNRRPLLPPPGTARGAWRIAGRPPDRSGRAPLDSRARPLELPESVAPARAVSAVQKAGIKGPVLNSYGWGGYLIYLGIPVFIDGRADMYGDSFFKQYVEALELRTGQPSRSFCQVQHRLDPAGARTARPSRCWTTCRNGAACMRTRRRWFTSEHAPPTHCSLVERTACALSASSEENSEMSTTLLSSAHSTETSFDHCALFQRRSGRRGFSQGLGTCARGHPRIPNRDHLRR